MYIIQDLRPGGDHWQMSKNGLVIYTGGFKDMLRYTVCEMGFNVSDFEKAIHALTKLEHNTLEFDSYRRLRSTSYQPVKTNRRAG